MAVSGLDTKPPKTKLGPQQQLTLTIWCPPSYLLLLSKENSESLTCCEYFIEQETNCSRKGDFQTEGGKEAQLSVVTAKFIKHE